jgi:hypothetical protein
MIEQRPQGKTADVAAGGEAKEFPELFGGFFGEIVARTLGCSQLSLRSAGVVTR